MGYLRVNYLCLASHDSKKKKKEERDRATSLSTDFLRRDHGTGNEKIIR